MVREELAILWVNDLRAIIFITTRAGEVALENQLCFFTVQLQLCCFNRQSRVDDHLWVDLMEVQV
jgi:hypothetical protein